jgi:hypothetical protein
MRLLWEPLRTTPREYTAKILPQCIFSSQNQRPTLFHAAKALTLQPKNSAHLQKRHFVRLRFTPLPIPGAGRTLSNKQCVEQSS